MSRKAVLVVLTVLLGLVTAAILMGGRGGGQQALAAVGASPAPDGSAAWGKPVPAVANAKAHALINDFGRVPVFFVPNRGQTDGRVNFYVRGNDKTIHFSPDGLTLALEYPGDAQERGEPERWVVKLDFVGSREGVKPEGLEETGAVISYFSGKPEEWKTGIPAFSRIIYRDLWPGIDLIYKGEIDKLKHEFVVHPGADPSRIKLAYRGAEQVSLTHEGRLEVKTPAGRIEDDIPVAYQENEGKRTGVPVAYSLDGVGENQVSKAVPDLKITPAAGQEGRMDVYGFSVGEYDRSRALIIDPAVLIYCGFIGGAGGEDLCSAVAVDGTGVAYITGRADGGAGFPVLAGPDLTANGEFDAFVAKVKADGTGLVYCGFIGGSYWDEGLAIAVDGAGSAYIGGFAQSTESTFPVISGPDLTHTGDLREGFMAKVNPSGTALEYCGYIGGSGTDHVNGLAVDSAGSAYVTGYTESTEGTFPVTIGPDLTYNGGDNDAFVAKVNAPGTAFEYCGYIGGVNGDFGWGTAVDSSGSAYITGSTSSTESTFPATVGPDLTYNGGDNDAFVAKVNPSGTALVFCGYVGGAGKEAGYGIDIDGAANAYIAGSTSSSQTTFPVKAGPDLIYNGGIEDAFVAKIEALGSVLQYCGYIGGDDGDQANGIAVDRLGNAHIVGGTRSSSSSFPAANSPDLTYNGNGDAFVAEVEAAGTALVYSGFIGGADYDDGTGIAVDGRRNVYIVGHAMSNEITFPVVGGPDLTINGARAGFVARLSPANVVGPTLSSILPDSADAGDPGFLLSVIGSDFVDGAIVRWDRSDRPTTFISDSELQAQIEAADLAAGKVVQVTVLNPDGGISNALTLSIANPLPTLSTLSTTQVTGGGAAFMLTVQGSNFVPNSIVRWNGSDRTTTYVGATELQASITATDTATGGDAQVTVFNPAPAGGTSGALSVEVSGFTLVSSPSSVTVTAGQSATYTITIAPQHGSFDSTVMFSCVGLPGKCTAAFSPTSVTPGAGSVTTTLTLTTKAAASATGASLSGTTGFGPPGLGLFALLMALLLASAVTRRLSLRNSQRWVLACAALCLVIMAGSCSSDGGGNDPPPYTGTPKGTHTISVQGKSGNMTVPTAVTLVVK